MAPPQADSGLTLLQTLEAARDRMLEQAMAQALAFHEAGQLPEAEDFYWAVLEEQPNHLAANANMGRMALELQKPEASLPFLKRALDANPADMQAWINYADALLQSRKLIDVQNTLQQCRKQGFDGTSIFQLAMRLSVAVEAWLASQSAVGVSKSNSKSTSKPKLPKSYQELCRADAPGKEQDARVALLKAKDFARLGPGSLDLAIRYPMASFSWKMLGAVYQSVGQHDAAEAAYLRSIELKPTDAEAHNNLGLNFSEQDKSAAAESSYREAIRLKPDFYDAMQNLLVLMGGQGNLAQAEALNRELMKARPNDVVAYSNLLFLLSQSPTITPEALFAEHCRFGEHFEGPLRASWPVHSNSRDPNRVLKVGFVSGDFYNHAVATFIEPVFAELANCKEIDVLAYYNNKTCDSTTQRLMALVPKWKWVADMADDELAEKIRADAIDILIDLSGVTLKHRLLTFARKPAPIQVSWIGYPGTTGLRAMDYFLADHHYMPPGKLDALFTEKIVRLSAHSNYQPPKLSPPLTSLPALQNSGITFGSFNRPSKISEVVVDLWARLLNALPDSKMILGAMDSEVAQIKISAWFEKSGVGSERLTFHKKCDMSTYLELHHNVDICLDTFPYNGGTTSWHAVWMGVPTLSLSTGTPASQSGAYILGQMGLQEFRAVDWQDFVLKGIAWSDRRPLLAGIRKSMRDRFSETIVGNPKFLAQDLSDAMRIMWQRWCARLSVETFET